MIADLADVSSAQLSHDAAWLRVDSLQSALAAQPQVECPLVHTFTPGLYARRITMPAGSLIISKIHKTEHPYVITKGKVRVWTEDKGVITLEAGHHGITKPGTRRILFNVEETVWTTYHPTDKTTVEEVENDIIEKRELPEAKDKLT